MSDPRPAAPFVAQGLPLSRLIPESRHVWRTMLRRPESFFDALRDAPTLSLRNAALFAFGTFLATLVFLGAAIGAYWLIGNPQPAGARVGAIPALSQLPLIALEATGLMAAAGVLASIINYLPARLLSRNVRFSRLYIGTLYSSSLLIVLHVAFLAGAMLLARLTGQGDILGAILADDPVRYLNRYPLPGWATAYLIAYSILSFLLAPALSILVAGKMTGIPPMRLLRAELLLVAILVGAVMLVGIGVRFLRA